MEIIVKRPVLSLALPPRPHFYSGSRPSVFTLSDAFWPPPAVSPSGVYHSSQYLASPSCNQIRVSFVHLFTSFWGSKFFWPLDEDEGRRWQNVLSCNTHIMSAKISLENWRLLNSPNYGHETHVSSTDNLLPITVWRNYQHSNPHN